ncbi:hypothetical protein [Kineococcus sp. G2]|uniref:hypothetical protein n=1 Tax=Kineococcus sp. G2 TaxID=3127484 RepID=UPI00301D29B1
MTEGRDREQPEAQEGNVLLRALRSTVGRESTTFGFSILVTVTFGLLQATEGSPDAWRVFLYAFGAVMSFTLLEGVLSKGFRGPMPQHRTRTLALGTSLNIVSVLAALGVAYLLARWIDHVALWAVAPFVAGVVYLVVESAEAAGAERLLTSAGDRKAGEVSDE